MHDELGYNMSLMFRIHYSKDIIHGYQNNNVAWNKRGKLHSKKISQVL